MAGSAASALRIAVLASSMRPCAIERDAVIDPGVGPARLQLDRARRKPVRRAPAGRARPRPGHRRNAPPACPGRASRLRSPLQRGAWRRRAPAEKWRRRDSHAPRREILFVWREKFRAPPRAVPPPAIARREHAKPPRSRQGRSQKLALDPSSQKYSRSRRRPRRIAHSRTYCPVGRGADQAAARPRPLVLAVSSGRRSP